jgi:hypothetical protein
MGMYSLAVNGHAASSAMHIWINFIFFIIALIMLVNLFFFGTSYPQNSAANVNKYFHCNQNAIHILPKYNIGMMFGIVVVQI